MSGSAGFIAPHQADRRSWLDHLGDRSAHDEIAAGLPCLHTLEVTDPPDMRPLTGWLRVGAWNIERGRDPAAIGRLLAATGAQVALLTELDSGMARTGNADVPAEVARWFGSGSWFGVEFVELGPGDAAEAARVGQRMNDRGLHGNAVLSTVTVDDARVIRLDDGGDWFNAELGQPRIGGRMAVAGTIDLDGTPVTIASVHLESSSDAQHRAGQMRIVFDAIDEFGGGPAIVGGDLNTFGADRSEIADRRRLREMRSSDPARFSWPVDYEPLFQEAAARGFEWVESNVAAPTTWHGPDGAPHHHPLHLDWLLVRGLEARRPTVVPATGPDGGKLSDHELIAVSVRLPRA